MGFVWNVMLACSNDEFWEAGEDEPHETCEPLEKINAWIDHGKLVSLIGMTYGSEAGYGMDANLFGGGFKHFDIDGFIDIVKSQAWKDRTKVQLWVKGGEEGVDDDPFTLIEIGARRIAPRKSRPSKRRANTKRAKRRT